MKQRELGNEVNKNSGAGREISNAPEKNFEERVVTGKFAKKVVNCLKGGKGKCTVYTDLEESCHCTISESGYIVMEPNASIGMHTHTDDSEKCTVEQGIIECEGKLYRQGETFYCLKGQSHTYRNVAKDQSIIMFSKWK